MIVRAQALIERKALSFKREARYVVSSEQLSGTHTKVRYLKLRSLAQTFVLNAGNIHRAVISEIEEDIVRLDRLHPLLLATEYQVYPARKHLGAYITF